MKTQKLHKAIPKDAHLGEQIAEGKTKIIYTILGKPGKVLIISKDDITADHGAKHDVFTGKGKISNQTACHVFTLLRNCGVLVAFEHQFNGNCFFAERCKMLPYEVVVRREAHGSYLNRNPNVAKGQLFRELIVEFFLKTSGSKWKKHELLCDDPLLEVNEKSQSISLFQARWPSDEPFLRLPQKEIFSVVDEIKLFSEMNKIAQTAFLLLEKAWQLQGGKLVDFKVEFGISPKNELLLADVIDNDSWRVIVDGEYIDKQVYRDGGDNNQIIKNYKKVMDSTGRFLLPRSSYPYGYKRGLN